MKNYAMPLAIAVVGLGLMSIGFNLNGNTATATPASFNAGPEEPTIVWYDSHVYFFQEDGLLDFNATAILRAWSDGTIEGRLVHLDTSPSLCRGAVDFSQCENMVGWFVISSPNEGLNARADINFDSRVNAEDLGIMLAAWGDAPRNDYPPSDCPLGLIP